MTVRDEEARAVPRSIATREVRDFVEVAFWAGGVMGSTAIVAWGWTGPNANSWPLGLAPPLFIATTSTVCGAFLAPLFLAVLDSLASTAVFDTVEKITPERLAAEEIGDALEIIDAMTRSGASKWSIFCFHVVAIFWLVAHSLHWSAVRFFILLRRRWGAD